MDSRKKKKPRYIPSAERGRARALNEESRCAGKIDTRECGYGRCAWHLHWLCASIARSRELPIYVEHLPLSLSLSLRALAFDALPSFALIYRHGEPWRLYRLPSAAAGYICMCVMRRGFFDGFAPTGKEVAKFKCARVGVFWLCAAVE